METVYFENNSSVLSQNDQAKINKFAKNPKGSCAKRNYLIQVDGYTNTIGTAAYNMKLSERRAEAVKEALVKAGVAPCQIQTKGYGELNPIADNNTAEGLKLNRRATIFLSDQFDKNMCKGKKANCACGPDCVCPDTAACKTPNGTPCVAGCKCTK